MKIKKFDQLNDEYTLKEIIINFDKKLSSYSLYKDANNVYKEIVKLYSNKWTKEEIQKSVESFYNLPQGQIPF